MINNPSSMKNVSNHNNLSGGVCQMCAIKGVQCG